VTVRPVSPDQHDAVLHYFDLVAYADNPNWSRCYCIERLAADYNERTKEQNRALRSELIHSAKANGLVAYRLGRVVGWCHAAPKTEVLNVPGEVTPGVGAIVCFVVAPDQRNQGIATTLLDAAIEHLRAHKATFRIEACQTPVCRMAMIFDPDGNTICIHKRNPGR